MATKGTGPRKAKASVSFSGNSAKVMAKYIKSFEYTDPASGESDEVKIVLQNITYKWIRYMPNRRDRLTAKIAVMNWNKPGKKVFDCGVFCVDDFTHTGPELVTEIRCVSVPEGNAFRSTARNKTWKKVTLSQIASGICGKYGMALSYSGPVIKFTAIEQSNETDCSFIKKLCDDYALAIKVYKGKLIIYDKAEYEAKPAAVTIDAYKMQGWTYNETLIGTYTGAEIKYTVGKDNKELTCKVGGGKRILFVNEKVDSLADAQLKACGKANTENEKAVTLSVTLMGNPSIAAGITVNIKGLYKIDGKYFVDKVIHKIDSESAYTMDLELHKVQKRITP